LIADVARSEQKRGAAFISYSRKDVDFVRVLRGALVQQGRDVWIDSDRIRPTAEWLRDVYEAIERSDAVIYIVSPHSIASKVCGQELAHAVRHNKRLVPLLYLGTPAESIPEPIRKVQWIDVRDRDAFGAAVALLVDALDTDLEWLSAHTRLLTRAIEWDAHGRDPSFVLRDKDLSAVQEAVARSSGKDPRPTELQNEYVRASQSVQAAEIGRLRELYNRALARQLAAQADLTRAERPSEIERSVLLAVEGMRRYPCVEADQALRAGLALLPRRKRVISHSGPVTAVTFSPNGRYLVSCSSAPWDNRVWIFDAYGRPVTYRQNASHVNALVFSEDGRLLATGDNAGDVCLYDAARWRLVALLRHDEPVNDIVLSDAGRCIVTAGGTGVVRLWRFVRRRRVAQILSTSGWSIAAARAVTRLALVQDDSTVRVIEIPGGRERACFRQESAPRRVAMTRNGSMVAITTSGDGTVRLWRVGAAEPMATLWHEDQVRQVRFSSDGRLLATACGNVARVWETTGGRLAAELRHDANVRSVEFSRDGRRLATASGDGTAGVWDVESSRPLARMPHRSGVVAVAFGRGGRTLASAGGQTVQLWNTHAVGPMVSLGHEAARHVAFARDDRLLVAAGMENAVRIWDVSRAAVAWRIEAGGEVERIALHPDGDLLLVATQASAVEIWSIVRRRRLARLAHPDAVYDIALSPDGSHVVSASGSSVHLWDVRRKRLVHRFELDGRVHRVAFHPGGRHFAASSGDREIVIREVDNDSRAISIRHEGYVRIVLFAPRGDVLASAGHEGAVRLWRSESGQPIGEMAHDANVNVLLFAADGSRLISASGDATARIWSLERLTQVARITHEKGVAALALSADGRFIASASRDGVVKVSEADTGREIARMTQRGEVSSLAFQPRGRYLATASDGEGPGLWLYRPEDMIAQAAIGLTRGFTAKERARYVGEEEHGERPPQ
jgi:WD40 repeat protein